MIPKIPPPNYRPPTEKEVEYMASIVSTVARDTIFDLMPRIEMEGVPPLSFPEERKLPAAFYVGAMTMVTSKHPKHSEIPYPSALHAVVPNMAEWIVMRDAATFSHFERIAERLEDLARFARRCSQESENLESYKRKKGLLYMLQHDVKTFQGFPKLKKGWSGVVQLAWETALNAVAAYTMVDHRSLFTAHKAICERRGVAVRIDEDTFPLEDWLKTPHRGLTRFIKDTPLWCAQMETDGFTFIAPEWFWHLTWFRSPTDDTYKLTVSTVRKIIEEYITDVFLQWEAGRDGALNGPTCVRETIFLALERDLGGRKEGVSEWIGAQVKRAGKTYKRAKLEPYAPFTPWEGFIFRKHPETGL